MNTQICPVIKTKKVTLLSRGGDQLTRWADLFGEVLNRPAPTISVQAEDLTDTLSISTEKLSEVRQLRLQRVTSGQAWNFTVELQPVQTWESDIIHEGWYNNTSVCVPYEDIQDNRRGEIMTGTIYRQDDPELGVVHDRRKPLWSAPQTLTCKIMHRAKYMFTPFFNIKKSWGHQMALVVMFHRF